MFGSRLSNSRDDLRFDCTSCFCVSFSRSSSSTRIAEARSIAMSPSTLALASVCGSIPCQSFCGFTEAALFEKDGITPKSLANRYASRPCLKAVDSKRVMGYLKEHPEINKTNVKTFQEEMQDLKAAASLILAFGEDAHKLLSQNLNKNEYSKLIKLPHYSNRIGKEAYKKACLRWRPQSNCLRDFSWPLHQSGGSHRTCWLSG
jgi:hypothetical protein